MKHHKKLIDNPIPNTNKKSCSKVMHFYNKEENRNTVGWWIYRFFVWGTIGILTHQIYLTATHNKKTPVEN
jgi:hypothetical protein